MSEMPNELRSLLADARRAYDPDQARLQAVRERLRVAAKPSREYDVAPPAAKPRKWPAPAVAALVVTAALLVWRAASELRSAPYVAPSSPRHSEATPPVDDAPVVQVAPQIVPKIVAKVAPQDVPVPAPRSARGDEPVVATPREPPAIPELGPSSDYPAANRAAAPALRRPRTSARPSAPSLHTPPLSEQAAPASGAPAASSVTRLPSDDALSASAREPDTSANLHDEVKWIARAQDALERGDVRSAEAALREHQREHPAGQLQAERTALLTRARCLAHDLVEARRLHAQLALLAPRSSLLKSVERACPELVH